LGTSINLTSGRLGCWGAIRKREKMVLVKEIPAMYYPDCTEDIILRYHDTVYRIAFTYCRNTHDAQDIAQEVFVRYLKKTPQVSSEEHLKAWLIRVTINTAKSLMTSSWFKKVVPISENEPVISDEPTHADTYFAVMSLSEKYRSVVMLYYYEDYTIREIAQILERTETAVQTQLQRARAMLKNKLKEEWGND
jgi:RNA polymerase sigma-70 factor (ECF subfamily)